MINATYIGINEFDSFKVTVTEKYDPGKSYLKEVQDSVGIAYNSYLDDFENLVRKTPIAVNNNQSNALKRCYSSRSATFENQRGRIFTSQPDILKAFCPYCLIDKPETLDHYTPKNEFPEYSILLKNLIPCCFDCNNIKDETWKNDNNRLFIHFYNDTFIKYKFLKAHIEVDEVPCIKFSLIKSNNLSDDQFNVVMNHFYCLNLIKKYEDRTNTLMSTEIKALRKSWERGKSIDTLKEITEDKALSAAEDYGTNYWKAVFYEALANQLHEIIK